VEEEQYRPLFSHPVRTDLPIPASWSYSACLFTSRSVLPFLPLPFASSFVHSYPSLPPLYLSLRRPRSHSRTTRPQIVVALGPNGSNFVLNSPAKSVSAEAAYTNFTTPVFGKDVVYDVPNHVGSSVCFSTFSDADLLCCLSQVFMQQKGMVKRGLTPENFRSWVPLVVKEVKDYLDSKIFADGVRPFSLSTFLTINADAFNNGEQASSVSLDPVHVAAEITICSASATLQGAEVRKALDGSFAQLFADLDGPYLPSLSLPLTTS
jgi:hypothetical protein